MADNGPAVFDTGMRTEIRRRLKSYQERHGIGAPTLWKRVRNANPRGFDFSQKTLQRLLDDSHSSFDAVYNECLLFLAANDLHPTDRIGEVMAGLFAGPLPESDASALQPEAPPQELEGEYQVYVEGPVLGDADPERYDPRLAHFPTPYSRIVFTAVPQVPWFRAVEYIGNPQRRRTTDATTAFNNAAESCIGTLTTLNRTGTYLVAMRGFRFNHPKFYFLTDSNLFRTSPPTLDGNGIDREPIAHSESVFAHLRVILKPTADPKV